MRKYILLLALSVLMSAAGFSAYAQNLVKVKGVVTSQDDGLPLIGVAVMAGPGNGVLTSLDGDYEIEVPAGTELLFSCIGFEEKRVMITEDGHT